MRETESHAGDPNFMTSLERGLQVIRAFSEHRHHLTISQVAQTTGLSRAAVRRCLYTLHKLGYVAEEDKRYSLKPLVLTLGQAFLSSTPLAVVAVCRSAWSGALSATMLFAAQGEGGP